MTWMMNQRAISRAAAGMFVLVLLFQEYRICVYFPIHCYAIVTSWHFSCRAAVKPNLKFFIFVSEVYVSLLSCGLRSVKVLCQHKFKNRQNTLLGVYHRAVCFVGFLIFMDK
jgi:hypothetical protein